MKSLSKGNSSRRDPLSSSSNLKDSTALPSSSVLSHEATFDKEINYVSSEKNRFGWSKQLEREPYPPVDVGRVPSGRMGGNVAASLSDPQKGQRGGQNDKADSETGYRGRTYDYEQDRARKTSKKVESSELSVVEDQRKIDSHVKCVQLPHFLADCSNPDDDLNVLLKVR